MGQGYGYKCKKCKHEYSIYLGVGMMYPEVYQRTVKAALDGAYGEEWRALMNSQKYMDIDASKDLYVCNCGAWKLEENLSVYAPNDLSDIENKQYGIRNVKEWGHVPYVSWYHREQGYHFIKAYVHKCDKCGMKMHKVDEDKIGSLQCPKCGCENDITSIINWD